jgi:predicted DCC family thiol-disulfide oxidoreductase YuxK
MAASVIVFDGVCVLCSRWVDFVLQRDQRGQYKFILRSFGPGWRFAAVLVSIVPRFIRDPLYRWVARHRYRMFGRRATCRVPTADIADRFLH